MLIDMDDTILSAYGRPEIAWNQIAAEFADEYGPFSPHQVASAVLTSARKFWGAAGPEWRLKLDEARRIVVHDGFAALAAGGHVLIGATSQPVSPTASPPTARKRCTYSPARMTRSTR